MVSNQAKSAPVITIDGPSASGKGTVCRLVANELGWRLLDSGALYRLTGLAALLQDISLDDEVAVKVVAESLDIEFQSIPVSDPADCEEKSGVRPEQTLQSVILLAGKDVSADIRSEKCGQAASKVAVLPSVRQALLERQRAFQCLPGLVADGRDMGTVVFPSAEVKIFITASEEERARRRHKQLLDKGISVSLADLLAELQERDERDQNRSSAPLVPATDSVLIDTTKLAVSDVVEQVLSLWRKTTEKSGLGS